MARRAKDDRESSVDADALRQADQIKRTKHRSPNYPLIGLRKAVERTQQLHEKYKRNQVPVGLAHQLWGYQQHSGIGNQIVGALKSFGLLDVDGEGKGRKVRISDGAYRILQGSHDRTGLLRQAAISPLMHRELWKKYEPEGGIPEDEILKHYLVFDREEGTFNPDVVDGFIANFKDSLYFAGLPFAGIIAPAAVADVTDNLPQIGDLVQWPSNGAGQFTDPRRVLGFSDDGEWAFVEGSETGVPLNELTIVTKSKETPILQPPAAVQLPPPNPYAQPLVHQLTPGGVTIRELPVTLPKSLQIATLRVPVPMDPKDFRTLVNTLNDMEESLVQQSAGDEIKLTEAASVEKKVD